MDWLLLKLEKEVKDLERKLEASQAEAQGGRRSS